MSHSSLKIQCGNEGYLQCSKVHQDSEILFLTVTFCFVLSTLRTSLGIMIQ